MSVQVIQGNALALPLADASVDLVVTSPPYFGLRSYQDGGEHYAGQLGSEPTPAEFVDALIAATREAVRVLKPTGSLWVNLGDKYASDSKWGGESGAKNGAGISAHRERRSTGVRDKSLIGVPWRYALRCIDDLGLILRAEVIWSKPNGLPESVTDRVRRSHETWFHLTPNPRYFSAVDEIREEHAAPDRAPGANAMGSRNVSLPRTGVGVWQGPNPLGKVPGSVWSIPTQPLAVPASLGVKHFAAFPMELPRRIIRGWSPSGICTACGEGRRPAVDRSTQPDRPGRVQGRSVDALLGGHGEDGRAGSRRSAVVAVIGETCACPEPSAPTRPAIVLDPFGGTGTTALVAHALGRHGISVDMSGDYCRLARWRTTDPGELAKALQVEKPPSRDHGTDDLFGPLGEAGA